MHVILFKLTNKLFNKFINLIVNNKAFLDKNQFGTVGLIQGSKIKLCKCSTIKENNNF